MKLSHILISGAFALCVALPTQAAYFTFASSLTGAAENPPVATPASGYTMVVYNNVLHTLTIDIDFLGLVGTTTAAHIHAAPVFDANGNAGVAVTPTTLPGFPNGVTNADYHVVVDLTDPLSYTNPFRNNFGGGTAAGAEAALFSFMQQGQSYVNVHSTFAGGGEIRGLLVEVPDTAATVGLFSLALGVIGLVARRARIAA